MILYALIGIGGAGAAYMTYRAVFAGARQIMDYAYLNTKIAAADTRMVGAGRVRALKEKRSVREAMEALSGTEYAQAFDDIGAGRERMFIGHYIARIGELEKDAPRASRPVFDYFRRELEMYNVYNAAAARVNGIRMGEDAALSRFNDVTGFGPREAIRALSLDDSDFLRAFKGSYFYDDVACFFSSDEKDTSELYNRMHARNIEDSYALAADRKFTLPSRKSITLEARRIAGLARDRRFRDIFRREKDRDEIRISRADRVAIRTHLGLVADVKNIMITCRRVTDGGSSRCGMINAGLILLPEVRSRLLECQKIDDVMKALDGTVFKDAMDAGMVQFNRTGRTDDIERRLDDLFLDLLSESVRAEMFSCGSIIRYLERKKREALAIEGAFLEIEEKIALEVTDRMHLGLES